MFSLFSALILLCSLTYANLIKPLSDLGKKYSLSDQIGIERHLEEKEGDVAEI